jgi:hypothetical protein
MITVVYCFEIGEGALKTGARIVQEIDRAKLPLFRCLVENMQRNDRLIVCPFVKISSALFEGLRRLYDRGVIVELPQEPDGEHVPPETVRSNLGAPTKLGRNGKDERDRQIVELVRKGMSYREVAKICGVSASTVWVVVGKIGVTVPTK